jgi:hypothetical protein
MKSINLKNQQVEESSHFSPFHIALDQEEHAKYAKPGEKCITGWNENLPCESANDVLAGSARVGKGYPNEKCDNEGTEYCCRSGAFYFDAFRPCKMTCNCAPDRSQVFYFCHEGKRELGTIDSLI